MSEPSDQAVEIRDDPAENRYVITVDGELAGLAQYKLGEGSIAFVHTEIDPDRDGQGLGSRLVEFAVTDARSRGLKIHPICPFVRDWIDEHPESP